MTRSPFRDRAAKVHAEISGPLDLLLAIRIVMWTVVTQGLKHMLPLPMLVRLMSRDPRAARSAGPSEHQIVVFARWASRLTASPRRGGCLERGLVTYRFLCAAGANPQLVVGFARNKEGALHGHAWVVVGDRAVDEGPESLEAFQPVGAFGPDGRRLPD